MSQYLTQTNGKTFVAAGPSPAAVAFATRITEEQFRDINHFAMLIDEVAEEARRNERKRIFEMGFLELCQEFWKGRKLYVPAK